MSSLPKTSALIRDPSVPRHVAIVMDGNGRWARQRMMPRIYGHKQGMDVLVRTVNDCMERGIEYLTIFAFSSENWKRPQEEVSALMGLVLIGVSKYLGRMAGDGVRVRVGLGDMRQQRLPQLCQAGGGHAAHLGQRGVVGYRSGGIAAVRGAVQPACGRRAGGEQCQGKNRKAWHVVAAFRVA